MADFSTLITSIVENMVPLITAAVRQGLETPSESSKRSRHGATPTHFRAQDITPTNLLDSFITPQAPNEINIPAAPNSRLHQPSNVDNQDQPDPSVPTPHARSSDKMEE